MDECVILLILIVIIAAIIVFYYNNDRINNTIFGGTSLILGAKNYNINNIKVDKSNRLLIADKAKLVVDGHNMIHQLKDTGNLSVIEFENALNDISKMLIDAYPTQDLHIVIKNPKDEITKIYNKLKNSKKNNPNKKLTKEKGIPLKKTSEECIPYFRELVELSKKFSRITYHLAYSKSSKKNYDSANHHLKSRDDFLTIYLANGSYMISQDRFRDFKQFASIKPFKHYSVTNGVVHEKETIRPHSQYTSLEKPSIGNHFIFKLVTDDELRNQDIMNGSIYLTENSAFGCTYIAKISK
jgi:hypothetical protein